MSSAALVALVGLTVVFLVMALIMIIIFILNKTQHLSIPHKENNTDTDHPLQPDDSHQNKDELARVAAIAVTIYASKRGQRAEIVSVKRAPLHVWSSPDNCDSV